MITQERLQELLFYEPTTGLFTWKVCRGNRQRGVGDIAGCKNPKGYIVIGIDHEIYRAHRLAFLYMEGVLPPDQVDHKDRVRDNNRWRNLRHADGRLNQSNMKNNNECVGVSKERNKYRARLFRNGRLEHLGCFDTYEEACSIRKQEELRVNV